MSHHCKPAGAPASFTRRSFLNRGGMFALGAIAGAALGAGGTAAIAFRPDAITRARRAALPEEGRRTGIRFGEAIAKLIDGGAIDPRKVRELYAARQDAIPAWMEALLSGGRGDDEIVFTAESSNHLLTLLWPMGLATRAAFNADSPIAGDGVNGFASTGGWPLGREDTGGVYFNSVDTVALDDRQSALVLELAEKIFRPCCDNSTFFQDCNHGSAVLGLLELGASQGRSRDELAAAALAASAFWFPDQMTEVAIHSAVVEDRDFDDVDPLEHVGAPRFSISGWMQNVHAPLAEKGLLPMSGGGQAGCGA